MKKAAIVVIVVFGILQFIRPERSNPTGDPAMAMVSRIEMDEAVKSILKRACADCHSYETQWPWYSYVAPSMWLVARDVKEGRQHLNLSEWGNYSAGKRAKKLYQISEIVASGEMPLGIYVLMHPDAKLNEEEKKLISTWAEDQADKVSESDDSGDDLLKSLNPNP